MKALKEKWPIGTDGERKSMKSVMSAWLDEDDDDDENFLMQNGHSFYLTDSVTDHWAENIELRRLLDSTTTIFSMKCKLIRFWDVLVV